MEDRLGTTLQKMRIRFIRDALNISTVKSYITQRHVIVYRSMPHMSSPLFLVVRAPTRTSIIHASWTLQDNTPTFYTDDDLQDTTLQLKCTERDACPYNLYTYMSSRFLHQDLILPHVIKSYSRKIGTHSSDNSIFVHVFCILFLT